jgi:hypothetical protein
MIVFFYSPSKRGRKDGGDDEPVNNILPCDKLKTTQQGKKDVYFELPGG